MTCGQAKLLFSPYLDSAVSGAQMQALTRHLEGCVLCNQQYVSLRQTQQLLGKLGRRKAPADLALKLRVTMSQEIARSRRPLLDNLAIRLGNAINAIMVPATAGLVTTVAIFGLLMGFMTPPLQAGSSDVPLSLHTSPQLERTALGTSLNSVHDGSLVIEAYVDSNGRVQDYHVRYDSDGAEDLSPEVKSGLIFTTFRPATFMGRPTSGRAILSFSKISVKG